MFQTPITRVLHFFTAQKERVRQVEFAVVCSVDLIHCRVVNSIDLFDLFMCSNKNEFL
jgi:hypothetical protein